MILPPSDVKRNNDDADVRLIVRKQRGRASSSDTLLMSGRMVSAMKPLFSHASTKVGLHFQYLIFVGGGSSSTKISNSATPWSHVCLPSIRIKTMFCDIKVAGRFFHPVDRGVSISRPIIFDCLLVQPLGFRVSGESVYIGPGQDRSTTVNE